MKRTERVTKLANLAGWALTALSLLCGGTQALAKENAQTGVAEVNGTKLYYETAGKGPAVVLVHGGLVDSRQWNGQMKEFAKRHRVVRYDLRGFGRSAAAPQPFSHIEDLRALMDFLKIERATVVGRSLRGIIAAYFALEHPERVDRLVLVGSARRQEDAGQGRNEGLRGCEQVHRRRVREPDHEVGALRNCARGHSRLRAAATDDARKLQGGLDFCSGIPEVPRAADHRAAWPDQSAHARRHRRREPPPSRGKTERI